jgi:hypothetical protein
MPGINYLDNAAVAKQIADAPKFEKSAQTLLRLPAQAEIGQYLITYVEGADIDAYYSDGGTTARIEATNKITENKVVARNPGFSRKYDEKPVFNEWLMNRATAIKNYGEDIVGGLSEEFSSHKKKGLIQAVQLNNELMEKLGVKGDTLEINVSWSDQPMRAKVGDWITNAGYSVSAEEFGNTYSAVSDAQSALAGKPAPNFAALMEDRIASVSEGARQEFTLTNKSLGR